MLASAGQHHGGVFFGSACDSGARRRGGRSMRSAAGLLSASRQAQHRRALVSHSAPAAGLPERRVGLGKIDVARQRHLSGAPGAPAKAHGGSRCDRGHRWRRGPGGGRPRGPVALWRGRPGPTPRFTRERGSSIRELFAVTPDAQAAGFSASSFSFNGGDGRCDHCQGLGSEQIEMQFLSDVFVPCPSATDAALQARGARAIAGTAFRSQPAGNDRVGCARALFRAQGDPLAAGCAWRLVGLGYATARPAPEHAERRRGPAAEARAVSRGNTPAPRVPGAAPCSFSTSPRPECTATT